MISKIIRKIRYISGLVIATPYSGAIVLMQLVSGFLSFLGLPMIIPVLQMMNPSGPQGGTDSVIAVFLKFMPKIGLEPNFYNILGLMSIFILAGQMLVIFSNLVAVRAQNKLISTYSKRILHAYAAADWTWLTNFHSGEMYYAATKEAEMASAAQLNAQRVVIYSIQTLIYFILTIIISPLSAFLAIVLYGFLGAVNLRNGRYVSGLSSRYNQELKNYSKSISGLQQNKKFFKASVLNMPFIGKITENLSRFCSINNRMSLFQQLQNGWNFTGTFLFLVTLLAFHKQMGIDYYLLALVVLVFNRIAPHFISFSEAYFAMSSFIPVYESFHKKLDELEHNKEHAGIKLFDGKKEIVFSDVGFSYPGRKDVLQKLNIRIPSGKTVAFVGGSGAGKTTVLDLILGLLTPSTGTIYYGEITQREIDLGSLRSRIAYVSQETTLLEGTLRDNLSIGSLNSDDQRIFSAAQKAHIGEFIAGLPKGLDTQIGENGIKLSGGQKQRLAIARALLMDPAILILDEATSDLDMETEAMVQDTIHSLKNDLTIIIVAHRLSTVRLADTIFVLDKGQLCESGSYDELLQKKGKFYHLDTFK